ncbi:putative DBINO protein [Hordeum vulgare]|nr:putative DBINO protein [Hordeum vulgare]
MADAHPNSGGPAVDQPGIAKKKKAKAPRKPRAECTPEEIAKLDAESTKRNGRAVVKDNADARKFGAERDAMEAARRKAEVEEKEAIVNKAHALLMLGICRPAGFSAAAVGPASTGSSARCPHPFLGIAGHERDRAFHPTPLDLHRPQRHTRVQQRRPTVRRDAKKASTTVVCGHHAVPPHALFDEMATPMAPVDPYYTKFMEDVIYNGGHVPAYDPEETQSQDGRAQFVADEEADDRADYNHGDSWHEDNDIYCECDGDEDEGNDIDISGEPLFIDERTQRAEAQKRKKSIHTGSYTQDEDKLICNCWMEISQDPRTGVQQKGLVFWTRVHKTSHERKMFEPYQITSDRGITSIQKRWLFIQLECNKYCTALESVEARPVSGLGIGDMTTKFAGGGDGEALKRPSGKTNSKVDDIRDAASMALHETLHDMMSQKDTRDEKKRQSKDEQMKQYLELQRKKLEMEEAAKKRKIDLEEAARQRQLDIEAANVEARKWQLDIEATNAATKAKEVALAIMSVDLTKMSEKTRSWFEARQKEMFDADGLN